MKNFIDEFKKFISRGSVIDMAIGIIIGGAFTGIVSSFVEDILNPIIGLFGGMNFDQFALPLRGDAVLYYGKFITAVINFLIIALVLFVIIKMINRASSKLVRKAAEPAKPTSKKCPYCLSDIAIEATRCPHCTSQLDQ